MPRLSRTLDGNMGRIAFHSVVGAVRLLTWVVLILAIRVGACFAAEPLRDSYGDVLPDRAVARLGTARFRHSGAVYQIFFFPDGQKLLTSDTWGAVHVWQVSSAERLEKWNFAGSLALALAPDGKTLVVAGQDGEVLLVETSTGKIRDRLQGHATKVDTLAISRDSKWLASATWNFNDLEPDAQHEKKLCLWSLLSGERVRILDSPDRFTGALAFDADASRLFSAGGKSLIGPGTIRVWNVGQEEKPREIAPVPTAATLLDVSPDNFLIVPRDNETLAVLDPVTGEERTSIRVGRATSFALSHDGSTIATEPTHHDGKFGSPGVVLWDAQTGRQIRTFERPHFPAGRLAWSPDDRFLAFGDAHSVRVIEVATGKEQFPNDEPRSVVTSLAVAPGKKRLIAAANSSDRGIRVWEQTGRGGFINHPLGQPDEKVTGLAFSDPSLLVASTATGAVKVFDVGTMRVKRQVFAGSKEISCLALNRDGRRAAFVHDDAIHIVDLDAASDSVVMHHGAKYLSQLEFSQDSLSLQFRRSGSFDLAQVVDFITLTGETTDLLPKPREFSGFTFSPDDKWLATSQALVGSHRPDDEVNLLQRETGVVTLVMKTPHEKCQCTVFSPDSTLLAAGISVRGGKYDLSSIGGAVSLWRVPGEQLARIPMDSGVTTAAFTPDGQWLVTGHDDSTIL
ncbi:MAG: WD40 repeat domain-containing protein, partial [Planctomycetota bacterium]|nr:WD40 repeat domain-containing protein [Planctomycetota bacterium]